MLQPLRKSKTERVPGNFVIVAAKFNERFTDSLVEAAQQRLVEARVSRVEVIRVPGSFEIAVVAAEIARRRPAPAAILCFGVILRGETTHAHYLADSVSHALMRLQIETRVPVLHGVYLFENSEQAEVRCVGKTHNRGAEGAQTALEMAALLRTLRGKSRRRPF
jgi:6,7-dimethyl-8-ribityllumazine synthase